MTIVYIVLWLFIGGLTAGVWGVFDDLYAEDIGPLGFIVIAWPLFWVLALFTLIGLIGLGFANLLRHIGDKLFT